MASCSTYLSNKLLDHTFGKTVFVPADTLYLAFYSVAPNSDGSGGTELPLTGGYSRKAIANNTTNFPNASSRQKLNGTVVDFANDGSIGNWAKAVAWKLLDASSGGNVYTFGLCTPAITVRAFKTHRVNVGKLIQNLT